MISIPLQNSESVEINILLFNWRDPKNPSAGGAEVFTHQILKRIVTRGHNVTQVSACFPGCEPSEVIDGVRFIRLGNKYTVYGACRRYYRKNKGKFDIVIDEINTRPFNTPHFVGNEAKLFTLIHQLAREFWFLETPFPISYVGYHIMEDYWLKRYRKIPTITVSNSTKEDLIQLGFENVKVVHEGYDVTPLDAVPKKEPIPTVIFVGRFKKAKLPDHALEAFNLAKKDIPNLRLWMVGDGYLLKKLKKLKVDDVQFFGRLALEEKNALISKAHLLLVPAIREGWGLVVTEANALGTPAVGYRVPGLKDSIKDGVTGVLCDNNPEAMAKQIVSLFRNEKKMGQLTESALKDSYEYDWERSTGEFLEILEAK